MNKDRVLVIGANGQIGTVLSNALRDVYGVSNVVTADITSPKKSVIGYFEKLDILDGKRLSTIVKKYEITQIYHLAAMLSAKGEQNPHFTWKLNMDGLFNVLEVARQEQIKKVYFPSSIAVFGKNTPQVNAPQFTALQPQTMYGITKVAGEHLCDYYYHKYGVDVRSLRYPGLISYQSLPGGGTTDYAVDIFHKAIKGEHFECFLKEDTRLPMMYMEDAVRATLTLMDAPADQISTHHSYNIQAMSFTPAEIAAELRKTFPNFEISYKPDFRQEIAESWIESMDDSLAKKDWGWKAQYDLAAMTKDMLINLTKKHKSTEYNETNFL
ncbi:MAG: NAD-dependent epimerase/dehydratase family protein [Saprospiraceae bacterium]|nr:NAD-dependent epimerase/dehydratase family protein [Saprospiraceae bacterium]